MNVKNFLLAGLAGGITDFLLGWVFYGMLFHEYFGGAEPNLTFIFAGCMTFGFLISYVYNKWANISTLMTGAKGGAVLGLIIGLMENFFRTAMSGGTVDYQMIAVDVVICLLIGAGVGAVVGMANGMLSKKST
jgi:hypothetical protein